MKKKKLRNNNYKLVNGSRFLAIIILILHNINFIFYNIKLKVANINSNFYF